MHHGIVAVLAVSILAAVCAPAAAQDTAPGRSVVQCYDDERNTLQTTLRHRCEGRIVSPGEAEHIADEIRRERARRLGERAPASNGGRARARGTRYGSAFAVTREGDILTARHVVEECGEIVLVSPAGESKTANLRALSPVADIALLAVDPGVPPLRLRADPPEPGMEVRAIGYPEHGLPVIRPLTMGGEVSLYRESDSGVRVIGFSAPVRGGASGGPLMAPDGTVQGLVIAKVNTPDFFEQTGRLLRDFTFAIAAESLRIFLAEHGIRLTDAPDPAEAGVDARERVLRVICRP